MAKKPTANKVNKKPVVVKEIRKQGAVTISRNEIILNGSLSDLRKLIKKHDGKEEYIDFDDEIKLLIPTEESLRFSDVEALSAKNVFYYCEKDGKLIINNIVDSSYEQIVMSESFFKDLAKLVTADFKISFLNKDNYELVFCVKQKNEILFESSAVENWEDPDQFEAYPYFVQLAIKKGLKKIKDEFDEELFDSEEVYDIIYEFRDNLLSGDDTYLNLAPDWYLTMK